MGPLTSPRRIDYYDDPNAPKASTLVPSVNVTGIAGIYSDPKHVILYTSNGEARQEFSIVLTDPWPGGTTVRSR